MLALVGSGEYLPPMEPVDRQLIEKLDGAPDVVCLPTAAGQEGEERIRYWSELGVRHFTRLGAQVETLRVIDRGGAEDLRWAERIREANFVYLSGGRPDYLYRTLKDTPVWQAILAVHQGGGVVAGCSAGAMIMGARLLGFPGLQPAFELIPDTVVVPHFDEIPAAFVKTVHFFAARDKTVVGIEGNTALVINGTQREVLGSGGVTIWNHRVRRRYTEGQKISWPGNWD
jgi:cyanophycinase